ncbi:nucleotidyl transferase AbiEii/AbiGii toxin family protein [Rahnella bonaserana]|uniref:nucleotidyl transferase AbiEii/AbiGii toxin family protein n=1 Tax=Rahnella bonaserana TaxID=2816248 RepID=UPI003D332840
MSYFPRLSVDIDLVYLPVLDREESLKGIKAALDDIAKSVLAYIPLAELLAVRRQLIDLINGKITQIDING